RILSQKLSENGLDVTAGSELLGAERMRFLQALQHLQAGDQRIRDSIPYAIVLTGTISTSPIEPYQGMYTMEANGVVKAIDISNGRTLVVENISQARGYGLTQTQASGSVFKTTGEQLADSFVKKLLANFH